MKTQPVLLIVSDSRDVLDALERDLRRAYSATYRILRATPGEEGLLTLDRLQLGDEPVALFLVDQRMRQMSGVEFLERASVLFPDAKRVLVTTDAEAGEDIRSMDQVKFDFYLHKPWDPPEEHLYPVLQDLLDEWQASSCLPLEGIRLIGHRWDPHAYHLRDLLVRNQVRYQWLDIDWSEEARQLLAARGQGMSSLPMLLFPDGSWLADPIPLEVARHFGIVTQPQSPFYDLIIIGAGPAGLGAAVYGASEGLRTVLIEREAPGGQAGMSSRIENYLGFPSGLSGAELTRRALLQATRFGAELLFPHEVVRISVEGSARLVHLADGTILRGHTLLLTTGVSYRILDVPGGERLNGAGVYYGASMSEAPFYRGQDVYLVGGANAAGQAALYFSRSARSVTLLVRGTSLTQSMSHYLIEEIAAIPTIRVLTSTHVTEVKGETSLEAITISNTESGETRELPTTALFVFIGAEPRTEWLAGVLTRDAQGYILSGSDLLRDGHRSSGWMLDRDPFPLETSVPGVFAAGDARLRSTKRVASAVGEGAMSVLLVHTYLGGI
jgi:thioredoxin reductase (NADPH)